MADKLLQNRSLVPLLFLLLNINFCYSQKEELKLAKEGDGIQVYKEKKAQDRLDRIIAQTLIPSNYMDVMCLIKNYKNHHKWVYANYGAAIIDSIDTKHWIYYGMSETPWPFQDRDVVTEVELMVIPEENSVFIHSVANAALKPASPEMVRVVLLDSKWKLTKISQDSTLVELDLIMDAGGGVPKWLIRLFSANGPFNTFKNMKEELKLPENYHCTCGYPELLIE